MIHCPKRNPRGAVVRPRDQFKGGEQELREAFASMEPTLQKQLVRQQIKFQFNPPAAPHFGGVWEREVRSIKSAVYTCVGVQAVHEDVPLTVLLEVEAILNLKPLGYICRDLQKIWINKLTVFYFMQGLLE